MFHLNRRQFILGMATLGLGPTPALGEGIELVIRVTLPSDRTRTGVLSLQRADGAEFVSGLEALGKSDNARAALAGNPDRSPTLPYGDTPEGTYSVPRIVDTGPGTGYATRSYGPNAAIVLSPASGDALAAAANGRIGLLIHGGDPGQNGRLRATHGCIRLSNADMDRLLTAIADSGNNPVFNRCEVVRVAVLVGNESEEGAGEDESDPPPNIESLLTPLPIRLP